MIDSALFAASLNFVRRGSPREVACSAAGIPAGQVPAYLADPSCDAQYSAAEAKVEAALLARVLADESGAGARWYLERRFPARYGAPALKAASAARVAAATDAPVAEPTQEPATAVERLAKRRAGLSLVSGTGKP